MHQRGVSPHAAFATATAIIVGKRLWSDDTPKQGQQRSPQPHAAGISLCKTPVESPSAVVCMFFSNYFARSCFLKRFLKK